MLTKEQKDGLIQSLYLPMFDYIEGIVGQEEEPGLFARLFKKKARKTSFGLAFELRSAAIYGWSEKAKFESRIMAILDAYLEGKVNANALPSTEPIMSEDEAAALREQNKERAFKALREFQWADLKSADDLTARRAIWNHDWVKATCAAHPETKQAYLEARAAAGWKEGEI